MVALDPTTMKNGAQIAHGPMLIGFMLNAILYGIMITQVYLYYTTYKKDQLFLKLLVLFLFIADTVNTVFDFLYLYDVLILKFGDFVALEKADWLFATDPAITGIIATTVQLFFAWRIRVLTKSWYFVGAVASLATAGVVGSIITAWEVGRTPNFVDFRNFKAVVIVWLASESLGDILITGILVTFLVSTGTTHATEAAVLHSLQRKHKTGFKNSDMIVDHIIRVTVQTGLLTSLVAILDLIFFLADPTGTHLIFNFPLCKLYTNSMMSSLNSRKGWRISSGISQDSARPLTEESFHVNSSPTSIIALDSAGSQAQSPSNDSSPQCAKVKDSLQFSPTNRPEIFVSVESHQLKDDIDDSAHVPGRKSWSHNRRDTCDRLHGILQAADLTTSALETGRPSSSGDRYQDSRGRGQAGNVNPV